MKKWLTILALGTGLLAWNADAKQNILDGNLQSDLNAGGHNITNAGTIVASNFVGIASNLVLGGTTTNAGIISGGVITNANGAGVTNISTGNITGLGSAALQNTNFFDLAGAGTAATLAATNNFGNSVAVNLTNAANQFTGAFTGNGAGLTNVPGTGGNPTNATNFTVYGTFTSTNIDAKIQAATNNYAPAVTNIVNGMTNGLATTNYVIAATNAGNIVFTNNTIWFDTKGAAQAATNGLSSGFITNYSGAVSLMNGANQFSGSLIGTATTATNLIGGSMVYVVKTNGWYSPSGMWHAETNSGNSLQDALNDGALYNTAYAYTYPNQQLFSAAQQIVNLPYPVGGTYEIASGQYCKPDGSCFWISNQIQTASWRLIGSKLSTQLIANSNVLDCAIHFFPNWTTAAYWIELDHLTFLSRSNVCAIQVNMSLAAELTYIHDCLFTMYDYTLLTNRMQFEEAPTLSRPPGIVGLIYGGDMRRGELTRCKFYGLAVGAVDAEGGTHTYENNFWSCSDWLDMNGTAHLTNQWSRTDGTPYHDTSGQELLLGAEFSTGAELIMCGNGEEYVERNTFWYAPAAIYIGQGNASVRKVTDNFIIGGVVTPALTSDNKESWTSVQWLNNYYQGGQWSAGDMGWTPAYSFTNITLAFFTNTSPSINRVYTLATNWNGFNFANGTGNAIWTNSDNTNWTIQFMVSAAGVVYPSSEFFVCSNNVPIFQDPEVPLEAQDYNWLDMVPDGWETGVSYLSTLSAPIPAGSVYFISYVNTITPSVTESVGVVIATGFQGDGSRLWSLPAAQLTGSLPIGTLPALLTNLVNGNGSGIFPVLNYYYGTNIIVGVGWGGTCACPDTNFNTTLYLVPGASPPYYTNAANTVSVYYNPSFQTWWCSNSVKLGEYISCGNSVATNCWNADTGNPSGYFYYSATNFIASSPNITLFTNATYYGNGGGLTNIVATNLNNSGSSVGRVLTATSTGEAWSNAASSGQPASTILTNLAGLTSTNQIVYTNLFFVSTNIGNVGNFTSCTFTNQFGVPPLFIRVVLVCVTNDSTSGWTVGHEFNAETIWNEDTVSPQFSDFASSTNFGINTAESWNTAGNPQIYFNHISGYGSGSPASNFNLKVYAIWQ